MGNGHRGLINKTAKGRQIHFGVKNGALHSLKWRHKSVKLKENAAKSALLQLLASEAVVLNRNLSVNDWKELEAIADQHLLLPLLHHQLAASDLVHEVPEAFQKVVSDEYRTSALRSLLLQSTLKRIDALLRSEDIPYVALKGARLAWRCYPDPAIRPMRDLDILVSPAKAVDVHRLLLENGCSRYDSTNLPDEIALESQKHLAPLRDDVSRVCIELHTRLFEPDLAIDPDAEMMRSDALIAGRTFVSLPGLDLPVLPAEEALVHCLVHAVYDSRCTSGPILLSDVRYLLANETFDWARVWSLAEQAGWVRGCILALKLAERFHGPSSMNWQDRGTPEVSDAMLDDFSFALMSNTSMKRDLFIKTDNIGSGNRIRHGQYIRLLFPERHQLSDFGRTRSNNLIVWGLYPAWLVSRIWRFLRSTLNIRGRRDVGHIRNVLDWINS